MAVETPRPVRDPDYYFQETPLNTPTFRGKAAKVLGIEGQPVDRATFMNLFDGYTTVDGERGVRLPKYMHPERRGAFEVTVSMPKTPSIVNEVGGDTRITGVHDRAANAVAEEVERQALVKEMSKPLIGKPKQVLVPSGGLVWARFDHSGSRAGDPHSHGHLVFMNLSPRKDWKAIELGKMDYPKLSQIYRDTLIKGFNELGYKTRRVGQEFEIVGVPAEVKAKFSRRNEAIGELQESMEAKTGKPMSSKAKGKLSVYNRPEKPEDRPHEERRKGWLSQLTDFEHQAIRRVIKRAKEAVVHFRMKQGISRHLASMTREVMTVERERGMEMER